MPDSTPDAQQDATTTAASIRDVPASCRCIWSYDTGQRAFVIVARRLHCPWHKPQETT